MRGIIIITMLLLCMLSCGGVAPRRRPSSPLLLPVTYSLARSNRTHVAACLPACLQVVRRVGEAGVGYCDPGSIRGEGANLAGMFQPTTAPKSAADIEKTLAKLATPIKPPEDDPRFRSLDVTALAALEGQASLATIEAMLPPPNILAQFRTGKTKRRIAPDDAGDTDVRNRAAALEGEDMDLNITRPRSRHSHKREAVRKKGEKNSLL